MADQASNGSPSSPAAGAASSGSKPRTRRVPGDKLLLGAVALLVWYLIFGAGLLVETVEYRMLLAPRSLGKQLGKELVTVPGQSSNADGSSSTGHAKQLALTGENFQAFVVSLLCFTPLNIAILALISGLLGGCESNIALATMSEDQMAEMLRRNPRRQWHLQEPPVSAAIRGFVVYLCVIGGLYVAMDDPFRDPTPAQYIRLAGMVSILAFLLGYDSSRLEDFLSLIPAPKSAQPATADLQLSGNTPRGEPPHEAVVVATARVSIPETQAEGAAKEAAEAKRLDAAPA